ncbi:MAG: hypothetical protein AAF217_10800 [Pseudomonadota bacterium]
MNRRRFLQSLVAVFSLPAGANLTMQPVFAAAPAAVAVPTKARFWAIYISALHGECSPKTLQNMLHIPELDAKQYITQLISEGAIKQHPLLQKSVTELVKPKQESVVDKVKKRLEMKSQAEPANLEISKAVDEPNCLESEAMKQDNDPEN